MCPKVLNGGLELMLTSLSGSLVQDMNMLGTPAHEPSFLLVDLSQVTLGDHTPKNLNTNFPFLFHHGMSP